MGAILYGKLDKHGYGDAKSPMVQSFTKEKIDGAHEKVWPIHSLFFVINILSLILAES